MTHPQGGGAHPYTSKGCGTPMILCVEEWTVWCGWVGRAFYLLAKSESTEGYATRPPATLNG